LPAGVLVVHLLRERNKLGALPLEEDCGCPKTSSSYWLQVADSAGLKFEDLVAQKQMFWGKSGLWSSGSANRFVEIGKRHFG
jgi:hypothetical protein